MFVRAASTIYKAAFILISTGTPTEENHDFFSICFFFTGTDVSEDSKGKQGTILFGSLYHFHEHSDYDGPEVSPSLQHFFYFSSEFFYFPSGIFYFPSSFILLSFTIFLISLQSFFFTSLHYLFYFSSEFSFTSFHYFLYFLSPFFTSLQSLFTSLQSIYSSFYLTFSDFYYPSTFFFFFFYFPSPFCLLPFSFFKLFLLSFGILTFLSWYLNTEGN